MKLIICIFLVCAIGTLIIDDRSCIAQEKNNHSDERNLLYNNLKSEFPRVSSKLLTPFLDIPRHLFVKGNIQTLAYQDMDLPAGTKTIIPAPSLVLKIMDVLGLGKKHSVLIIGRGTGYMGAVMSEVAESVTLVELDEIYYGHLLSVIGPLEFDNIELFGALQQLPGTGGAESRRFDRIVIHAGIRELPAFVTSMLRDGGQLIVPITSESGFQTILRLRIGDSFELESIRESFFPLIETLY
jgi:protein-L-isoaspartate O-methyltransferase